MHHTADLFDFVRTEVHRRTRYMGDPIGEYAHVLRELQPVLRMAMDMGPDTGRVLLEGCIEELLPISPVSRVEYGDTLDG
jgi:hypothetical protein